MMSTEPFEGLDMWKRSIVTEHPGSLIARLLCRWFCYKLLVKQRSYSLSYSLLCRRITNARNDVFIAPCY